MVEIYSKDIQNDNAVVCTIPASYVRYGKLLNLLKYNLKQNICVNAYLAAVKKLKYMFEVMEFFIRTFKAGKEFLKRWIIFNCGRKQNKILEKNVNISSNDYLQTTTNLGICISIIDTFEDELRYFSSTLRGRARSGKAIQSQINKQKHLLTF